jgi:hypothetical protein
MSRLAAQKEWAFMKVKVIFLVCATPLDVGVDLARTRVPRSPTHRSSTTLHSNGIYRRISSVSSLLRLITLVNFNFV